MLVSTHASNRMEKIMANGARTAPAVDGVPVFKLVSIRYIDFTGDKRSVSLQAFTAVTPAMIEAMVAATVPGSNASIYEIRVTDIYPGVALATNALEAVWENVNDNIVLQFKDPVSGFSLRNYIPSPVEGWFVNGTDNIDPANTEFIAWKTTTNVVLDVPYFPIGVRFTPRKDNNPSTPL